MLLNNRINVSILRTMQADQELRHNIQDLQAIYKNGMYQIETNFMEYNRLIQIQEQYIEITIVDDIEKVFNHLVYRTKKEKLNPIEIAFIFEEIKQITRFNQKQMAELLGKTPGNISNKRRLLKLPLFIQIKIINGELTERHGRAILQLIGQPNEDELIQKVYKEMIQKKLNVSQTEAVIDKLLGKEVKPKETNITKIEDKRNSLNNNLIPLINQLESDVDNTLELITKYNPEAQIIKEEGLLEKDYIIKIQIKNAKK